MPRNTRQWARRELENAKKNIDWIGVHLSRVGDLYQELHPEISEPIHDLLVILAEIDRSVDVIRAKI